MENTPIYFYPKEVNDIFVALTQLAHCSGHEDPVRKYVGDFIRELEEKNKLVHVVNYVQEATDLCHRVIVVRKDAAPGYEHCPTIILQAHMDMVCKPDCNIFPLTLLPYEEKGVAWLKAGSLEPTKGTTLGADDGIGVAIALAALADDSIKCPLEVLLTVEEETTMGGAANFAKEWLTGRIFINLDSEVKNIVTYGSAGGIDTILTFTPTYSKFDPHSHALLRLEICKLKGGHSGVDINKGRANAIKLMARTLFHLNNRTYKVPEIDKHVKTGAYDFLISQFNSNDVDNAIPSEAKVIIAVKKEDVPFFRADFIAYGAILHEEYGENKSVFKSHEISMPNPQEQLFDAASSDKLINLLLTTPHGVVKMSSTDENLVETSTNLAMVKTDITGRRVQITCSHRSSTDSGLEYVVQMHQAVAATFGCTIENTDWYPSWTPNKDSRLLGIAQNVYQNKYHETYKSEVIHAGLECSWVVEHYKGETVPMDAISLGPTLQDVHTPDERLETASVQEFWDSLMEIIAELMK